MRFPNIFLSLLLFGCVTKQQHVEYNRIETTLPQDKEIDIDYKVYNMCSSYYFVANDTLNPLLARVLSHDEKGREKEVIYRRFESYVPAISLILYDSSGKKAVEYYRIDEEGRQGALTKNIYCYNEQGQLIRSVAFDFTRRIKKGVDKGFGRPGGCTITEKDYETYKSWALATIWNYKYDNHGRLVEKAAPVINSSQNRYLYQYDKKGRIIEERSLEGETLIYIERYNYSQGGYEFTRTWFENDGRRQKEWDGSLASVDTFRFVTDKLNNITQELVIEEGGRLVNKHDKFYDGKNRLVKHEIFNDSGKLLGYYVYHYIVDEKPTQKNFFVNAE